MITDIKYKIYPIEWSPEYEREIQTVYQMFKDQGDRTFGLAYKYNWDNPMDCLEYYIKQEMMFVVVDTTGKVVALLLLDEATPYQDICIDCKIHILIRRICWGKEARLISQSILDFIHNNFKIKKLIAEVPQCRYGVIKLLKDMNFKHEGTLRECELYLDKGKHPKWYDRLIYTLTRKDI